MPDADPIRNRMLAAITAAFVIAALNASYPVAMPVAAAVVITVAAWPVKPWLEQVSIGVVRSAAA